MKKNQFNNDGLDSLGIHWKQYLSMTLVSLLIFFICLDKAIPGFHLFLLSVLFKLQCSGLNCNGIDFVMN